MRISLTTLFLALFSFTQLSAQLPNGGFEAWSPSGCVWGPDTLPEQWITSCNLPLAYFTGLQKSTDAYAGQYCANLTPAELGDVIQQWAPTAIKIRVLFDPGTHFVTGYYRYSTQHVGDSAAVYVIQKKYQSGTGMSDTLSFAHMKLGPASQWTAFSFAFPTVLPPLAVDSLEVWFASEYWDLTPFGFPFDSDGILEIDDIDLAKSTAIDPSTFPGSDFHLFAEPGSGRLRAEWDPSVRFREGSLQLFDLQGRKLATADLDSGTGEAFLDNGAGSPGMYIARLIVDGRHLKSVKILLQP